MHDRDAIVAAHGPLVWRTANRLLGQAAIVLESVRQATATGREPGVAFAFDDARL